MSQSDARNTPGRGPSRTWKNRDSKERRYVCSECNRSFSTKQILERHMRRHTDNRPFKCNLCEKAYTVKVSLDAHLVSHFGEKPFRCARCDFSAIAKSSLWAHQRTHDGNRPKYKCPHCALVYSSTYQLSIHADRDHRHALYCCDSCDFATRHLREKKLNNGTCDGKAFKCGECAFETTTLVQLKRHRDALLKNGRCTFRTNEKLPRLLCAYCDFKTMSRKMMQRHIMKRDKETKKCPKTYWKDVKASNLEWLLRADRKEIVVKDKLPTTDEAEEEEDPAQEGPLSDDDDRTLPSVAPLDGDGCNDGGPESKDDL